MKYAKKDSKNNLNMLPVAPIIINISYMIIKSIYNVFIKFNYSFGNPKLNEPYMYIFNN